MDSMNDIQCYSRGYNLPDEGYEVAEITQPTEICHYT